MVITHWSVTGNGYTRGSGRVGKKIDIYWSGRVKKFALPAIQRANDVTRARRAEDFREMTS